MQRDPRRWQTSFGRYVARRGVPWVVGQLEAEGLPVTPFAVYHWVAADTAPRPTFARALVRTSGGALTLDDIYGHSEQLSQGCLDRGAFGPGMRRLEGAACKST
jgi:hypothetical protein